MTITLDTGIINNPLTGTTTVGNVVYDKTPSERVVYPSNYEQLIAVKPSEMAVITAYGLAPSDVVYIEKLLVSSGTPETAIGSCQPKITSSERMILNRVKLKSLSLCENNPVSIIDIPGVYGISVKSSEENDIIVTAVNYPLQQKSTQLNLVGGCNGL